MRSHPEWERPYTGIVELATGEIAEDLAKYLVESEQQNSALALGVSINKDARVCAAGGYLIQVRLDKLCKGLSLGTAPQASFAVLGS